MCYDLTDPNNSGRAPAASAFGPSFGFSPQGAINNPSTTSPNDIEGLTIVPRDHPQAPYILNFNPIQTITQWNIDLQPLNLPELIKVVPFVWNMKMKAAPCLQREPAGINMAELLSKAFDVSFSVAVNTKGSHHEWGSFLVRLPGGAVGYTPVFTANHPNDLVGAGPIMFPVGSQQIIAFVHSHPWTPGVDERFLSDADIDMLRQLIADGKADPNVVAIIATPNGPGDDAQWNYYMYDAGSWNSMTPGCKLEVDFS